MNPARSRIIAAGLGFPAILARNQNELKVWVACKRSPRMVTIIHGKSLLLKGVQVFPESFIVFFQLIVYRRGVYWILKSVSLPNC